MSLRGRTALITGGNRGIGFAIARQFMKSGANVAVAARKKSSIDEAVERLQQTGHSGVLGEIVDVCNAEQVDGMVATVVERFGCVDILVNSAGVASAGHTPELDPNEWHRIIDTNLNGVFRVTRSVLTKSGMLRRRYGRIINIASTAGKQGVVMAAAYTASKYGVIGFTNSLGIELAKTGVTVNAICPGIVESDMSTEAEVEYSNLFDTSPADIRSRFESRIPLGRYLNSDEIASVALYLASEGAAAIIGQAWNVCGGLGKS